ncbi:MAG: manganese efflux pump [Bacteroidales bacterium]|nr:manganese efflux pump [Bacteroidales bacterium]
MEHWEIMMIAFGVSMDAFAVSVGKGLSLPRIKPRHSISVALWFGGFQALMPLLGYCLGRSFASLMERFDHWTAFALLALIGGNMMREALREPRVQDDAETTSHASDFGFRTMLGLAIATSIDALACGVSFAMLGCNIWLCVLVIGLVTASFSVVGLYLGHRVGSRFRRNSTLAGGILLILIGLKILIEHLFF